MFTSFARRAALSAGLLITVVVRAGLAQVAPEGALSDAVEVRAVDVDVTVVDREGQPVLGLEREDFEVLEDGRSVPIDYFLAPSRALPRADPSAVHDAEARDPEPTGSVRSRLVAIYVDDYDLQPAHRARVLADLRESLGAFAAAEARFLLARYRSQLEVLVGPTSDPDVVLARLEGEPTEDARGLEADLAIRQTQRAIVGSYQACESARFCVPCVDNWDQMLAFATDYARAEETRTAVAVAGLADLTSLLAGLPGRKDVIYVGDGFQQRPGVAMLGYVADVCADERDTGFQEVTREAATFDESNRFTALAAHAAANRVTFHMVDAGGVRSTSGSSVEYADRKFAPTVDNDQQRIANLQGTHFVLANETGGKAILNASRPLEDLERLGGELASVYSLGFTPQHPASGRVHLLEVRLVGDAAKGRSLRYRRSYRDKQLEARLADELVAALFLDEIGENRLGVQAWTGDTTRVDRKSHQLPVRIALPASTLSLPGSGLPRSLRVWMTAVSDDGRRTGIRQQLVELGPEGVEPDAGIYSLVVDMELPEGDFTIAVGVRDELTGESSFARVRASVPTSTPQESP